MKRILLICLSLTISSQLFAQDPHFTQYFASPLSLNPAYTGFFDGDMRVALNQRQQWANVGYKYNTTSISVDAKLLPNRIPEDDILAVGLSGVFDASLNGALKSNYISASAAYHKSLDEGGRQRLSVGLQFTYANTFIDFNNLTFASQYDGNKFDTSIPVSVDSYKSSASYYDAHAGVLYSFKNENASWYAGASVYHLARPTESLFTSEGIKVPFRETFHAGGEINMGNRSSIILSGMYMTQNGAHDQMIGAIYSVKANNNENAFNISFGSWLRFGDSYVPYVGMDFQDFTLGMNYAVPYNNTINYRPNTVEISLIYRKGAHSGKLDCPRF
ncbi:type IX secretion system PorP/SprF family membrane protein [Mucilaginibacter yixingensis]|uniref:Type IX secretion system PorP/SprF family membrane protein n=1 Tax=Mucilaginibacter yixingensis TaxID=1295612 RepID=A0A2T5J5D3_9SPHI|nr:PorP/SprF family type IX secretion system membrane protein [Mucilaginibacter yixingensis]PTQ92930.1 type IX secretion system PorP/SprF family membrane protein [Mucilaginibacter yixingensis]